MSQGINDSYRVGHLTDAGQGLFDSTLKRFSWLFEIAGLFR
jgi:hypothetical protein